MKKIYTLVLSLIIVCSMQAKNFYVSVNGDDSNSGSKSKPWRTPELSVKRALDYMRDNPNKSVQLIVCEGEYFIKQSITINGADINAPFTIMADAAVKAADVDLIDLRLGSGIGGKSFAVVTGEVAAVQEAINCGIAAGEDKGLLVSSVVIPHPHPDLFSALL